MATAEDYRETWYEDAMASREQALATVLGLNSPPNQVFKPADQNFELTVPGFAFLRYPPAAERPFWLYVTHGLAQPAEFEAFSEGFAGEGSGYGVEFALATAVEETWPFPMLELLANYVLGSLKPVFPGDRIPASDLMEEARGGGLMALPTPAFTEFKTLSGTFDLVDRCSSILTPSPLGERAGVRGKASTRLRQCLSLGKFFPLTPSPSPPGERGEIQLQ